ncbi:MAG: Lrp/AsnC family transcriptional regulator [Euryarchaeota archaeon]|nr:Lrp/AsnC family transcriptional regulator [Euryarchaeota archaeon]
MVSEKQLQVLRKLYEGARSLKVHSTQKTQAELAAELGISRQALSAHLRELRERGLIRTGRGFIDLTDRALAEIGKFGEEAFVLLKVKPAYRDETYARLRALPAERVYRVAGEYDVIAVVPVAKLREFLDEVAKLEGVEATASHVVIEMYQV